ncbi:MAG: hypothetical protein ACPLPR_07790 [Bacillota bacterium]
MWSPWCGPGRKRLVWVLGCLVLLLAIVLEVDTSVTYQAKEYCLGTWGSGDREFGLLKGRDGFQYGPLCFAVGPSRELVIPDVPNKRFVIVRFSPEEISDYTYTPIAAVKQVSCLEMLDDGSLCYSEPLGDKVWFYRGSGLHENVVLDAGNRDCLHSVEFLGDAGKGRLWVVESLWSERTLERLIWLLEPASGKRRLVARYGPGQEALVSAVSEPGTGSLVVQLGGPESAAQKICAFDVSGTLKWQRGVGTPDGAYVKLVGADSDGYCYLIDTQVDCVRVLRVDKSGLVLNRLSVSNPPSGLRPLVCRVDPAGAIYLVQPRQQGLYLVWFKPSSRMRITISR